MAKKATYFTGDATSLQKFKTFNNVHFDHMHACIYIKYLINDFMMILILIGLQDQKEIIHPETQTW